MTTDRRPITREEIAMTPRAIMAETIAFRDRPLTTDEVEDLVDSGLAVGEDFVQADVRDRSGNVTTHWRYVGDRWEVTFTDGRPVLAEAGTAPRGHRALVERRFALSVWTMRIINARPLTDGEVAVLRADPGWVEEFEAAADADRRLLQFRLEGGPEVGLARQRLERLRRTVAEHGLHPTGDWADDEAADDESTTGRYATLLEGLDSRGRTEHEVFFCDRLETLQERALTTTVIGGPPLRLVRPRLRVRRPAGHGVRAAGGAARRVDAHHRASAASPGGGGERDMTHTTPDAVLLVMPRDAWDVLAGTRAPDVRSALDSLVQVDRVLHLAVRSSEGGVESVAASVHLDAAEAVAERWSAHSDHPEVTVLSVPVGLDRPREATP